MPGRGRFDYRAIVMRIEKERAARGMPAKQLYEAAGITGDKWYRKLRGDVSTFTLTELGAIAEALAAPDGWPFVEWDRIAGRSSTDAGGEGGAR